LEQAVFSEPRTRSSIEKIKSSSGPTQGILTLVEEGFFDAPDRKSLKEVMSALVEHGKDYSRQAVHIALRRLSSGKTGTLVRHMDKNEINYVRRG
jgi:hypothetical protein